MDPGRSNLRLRSGSVPEDIILGINEMIERGEIPSDGRLPAVPALAKILGITLPALQGGIRSLANIGILRSRQGIGTFVNGNSAGPTLDGSQLRLLAAFHGFGSSEIFEAWLLLVVQLAALAAERAKAGHLAGLAEEMAEMFTSLDDADTFARHEMRFLQIVAAASGNGILTALMNMVMQASSETRLPTVCDPADLKRTAEMHRDVYHAIRDRDPEAARRSVFRKASRLSSRLGKNGAKIKANGPAKNGQPNVFDPVHRNNGDWIRLTDTVDPV